MKTTSKPQDARHPQPDGVAYQQAVLRLLDAFVAQRSGLRSCDYGSTETLRKEQREIGRARHDYRALRDGVSKETFSRQKWVCAFVEGFSGRLRLIHDDKGAPQAVEYDTGSYFPTEYRRAACAVLACLVWDRARDATGRVQDRRPFIREYGRGVARRWLDS